MGQNNLFQLQTPLGLTYSCSGNDISQSPAEPVGFSRVILQAMPVVTGITRGQVAQLVEHRTENPGVAGSIPALPNFVSISRCYFDVADFVDRFGLWADAMALSIFLIVVADAMCFPDSSREIVS